MCIDEGDCLDQDAISRLVQIAEDDDFQVWMTAVYAGNEDDEKLKIVSMENGREKGDDTITQPFGHIRKKDLATMYDGVTVAKKTPNIFDDLV
jgi:hypothetical protein